ncbi:large ribosomal subunit protein P2-like [Drosophila montana]|uniref:large ribosomal subunit protein P2-like n=1 Tax=Drosophila montana TaxID=40370 RepID=UPI00313DFF34
MRYVAADLLAVLGGPESPANVDLEKILSSVGVIKELKGKSIDDLIKEGREILYGVGYVFYTLHISRQKKKS